MGIGCVLDVNMGAASSLPTVPQLRLDSPETAIVVLTMQSEPAFARQALQSRASAHVLKDAAEEELVHAVRAAARGEIYLNPQLGARLASEIPAPAELPPSELTSREIDVLHLIALGNTNNEIAGELYLSVRTIQEPPATGREGDLARSLDRRLGAWVEDDRGALEETTHRVA
jgi:two-component system response regulator NreC